MKRSLLWASLALAGAAIGCGEASRNDAAQTERATAPAAARVLDDVLAGDWRGEDVRRDRYRNPKETLLFLGLEPGMTIVEIWPGRGWYANVLAPFAARTDGAYVAAHLDPTVASERAMRTLTRFDEMFVQNPDVYGEVTVTAFGRNTEDGIAEPASADLVVSFRNLHNWIEGGYADKAFAEVYAALKPGGVFGLVDHRAPDGVAQDNAPGGYVSQDHAIDLARAAGFEFIEASEVNANPADTKDHPFGVWTLPPTLRGAAHEGETAQVDRTVYLEIGESDRFTLKFQKPNDEEAANLD